MQADSDSALKGLTTDSARGPVITITIFDENKVMTVKEVGDIGIPEFAKMYSVSPQLFLPNSFRQCSSLLYVFAFCT